MRNKPDFLKDIFPEELKEISKRRKLSGLPQANIENDSTPSSKLGLIGLALSGGGIRSATFSLGVIQGFLKRKAFRFVDYLSTVSGGGYLGSCLSSLLNTRRKVDTLFTDTDDAGTVKHLRNNSNYLAPKGLFDKLRLPLAGLRGIFLVLFLFMPFIIGAVIGTEILNEIVYPYFAVNTHFYVYILGLAGLLFILFTLYPFAMRVFGNSWEGRERFDFIMTCCFSLLIFLLVLALMLKIVGSSVNYSMADLIDEWVIFFDTPSVWWGIIIFLVVISLLFFTKFKIILIRVMVGFFGPMLIIAIYLLLCVYFIESPFIDYTYKVDLEALQKLNACVSIEELKEEDAPHYKKITKMLKNQKLIDDDPDKILIKKSTDRSSGTMWDVTIYIEGKEEKSVTILEKGKNRYLFIPECSIARGYASWELYLIGMAIFIINFLFLDVNLISQHVFYRDRLSKAYLIQDSREDKNGIIHNDRQKLSQLNKEDSIAPYHLINTALNVPKSGNPDLRGRDTDFFTFSKHYTGSEITGYCKTKDMEKKDPHMDLGTAMAISAAAASPSMGTLGMTHFTFIMTVLNIRLSYWAPNPSYIAGGKIMPRFTGPLYLLKEAVRSMSEKSRKINLSDGGHIENSGVYQLLKRRCRLIIAVDGEADPNMTFKGLSTLMRYAKIDMGIDIDIDLEKIGKNEKGLSKQHWALGKVTYPGKTGASENPETGILLYIKSSLKGDESEYIKAYRREHPKFPHQSTADQFFTETQFEVYRALGEKIVDGIFSAPGEQKTYESAEEFIECIELKPGTVRINV